MVWSAALTRRVGDNFKPEKRLHRNVHEDVTLMKARATHHHQTNTLFTTCANLDGLSVTFCARVHRPQ